MTMTRREALLTTLFGAGYVGLRALATGLPPALLLNPRRALAAGACPNPSAAQYIILSTSGQGDPINANVPGMYLDPKIVHPPNPMLAATSLTLAGQSYQAAMPWSTLPQNVLDRTSFWHIMTDTPVHPREPDVLKLMGAITPAEMLPSLLAKQLAPCLGTLQTQPITLGATTPSEGLSFAGQALPIIPPLALRSTLTAPAGPLANLQMLRDQTLEQLGAVYATHASPAQKAYLDALTTSQLEVRNIRQDLLASLASINDNSVASQITAAVTLIQMKVAPVIAIHVPFGGDNHHDANLQTEATQTMSGVASIGTLMAALASAGLQDQVSFVSLNVFGRTVGPANTSGRQHNPNHQVSIAIGKPFRGGVVGGVAPVSGDYGALPIDSKSGTGVSGGDVAAVETLGAFGKTLLQAVGADPTLIGTGKVIPAALA